MVSQRTIAEAAGVERSTVSLALRDDPRIPEATRARVRVAAERLGYRPHPVLSELARRRWRGEGGEGREQLAFLRTLAEDHPMEAPARRRAEQLGFGLTGIDPRTAATPRRLAGVLTARGIRGLLIEQGTMEDRFGELDWNRFVAVQCGLLHRSPAVDLVGVDFLGMVNEAVERAQSAGARRVGFFLPSRGLPMSDRLLRQAVRGRAEDAGLRLETPIKTEAAILCALKTLHEGGVDHVVATDAVQERYHRKVFGERAGFVALFRKAHETRVAGFAAHEPLVAVAAVDLLVAKLAARDYGVPAFRRSVHIVPPWIEGTTTAMGSSR